MQTLRTRPGLRRGGVLVLRPEDIRPNPLQPRKQFDEGALRELSESIRQYGLLNPLTVRLRPGGYELVAGERRLRAAKLAGLREVPCLVVDVDLQDAGLLALVENLQRKDLDFWEEAQGIRRLIDSFHLSQEEAALRDQGLSERHGRALLRLPDAERQRSALAVMLEQDMTVAAAEAYVEALLSAPDPPPPAPKRQRSFLMKDVRLFLNSINHSLALMKEGGIQADMARQETDDALILTISIPKTR